MQSLKSEFLKEVGDSKETKVLGANIKKGCYNITKAKIGRLKNSENKKQRVEELIKNFIKILESENIENINTISAVIDGCLQAISQEKEQEIYQKISMVTKLNQEIEIAKEELKTTLQDIYKDIENFSYDEKTSHYVEKAINDTKLKEIMLLGILKETTEEAIITTIENKKNIEKVIETIIQNTIFQAISGDDFSKAKTVEATKSIVDVATNIADEYQAYAKEILQGTIQGVKNGISNAVNDFNNNLEFLPDEIRDQKEEQILFEGLNIIDLNNDFIELLKDASQKSNGVSKSILEDIIFELSNSINRLVKITANTKEHILKKVERLKENPKVNELKKTLTNKLNELQIKNIKKENIEQVAKESKKLGLRAWEVAKNALEGALKSTKENTTNPDKNNDKE